MAGPDLSGDWKWSVSESCPQGSSSTGYCTLIFRIDFFTPPAKADQQFEATLKRRGWASVNGEGLARMRRNDLCLTFEAQNMQIDGSIFYCDDPALKNFS